MEKELRIGMLCPTCNKELFFTIEKQSDDKDIEANNKEIHNECFDRMIATEYDYIELNKSYIGHILTISIAIIAIVIPLMDDEISLGNNIYIYYSNIGFLISIFLSIAVYITGRPLQRKELDSRIVMVDLCNEYLYDKRYQFQEKLADNKQSYINDCTRKVLLRMNDKAFSLLNTIFMISILLFCGTLIFYK